MPSRSENLERIDGGDILVEYSSDDWDFIDDPNAFLGTVSVARSPVASLEFPFTGARVSVYGLPSGNGSSGLQTTIQVKVDEEPLSTVQIPFTGSGLNDILLFRSPLLSLAGHRLSIFTTGASLDAPFYVDYFQVDSTSPFSSVTGASAPSVVTALSSSTRSPPFLGSLSVLEGTFSPSVSTITVLPSAPSLVPPSPYLSTTSPHISTISHTVTPSPFSSGASSLQSVSSPVPTAVAASQGSDARSSHVIPIIGAALGGLGVLVLLLCVLRRWRRRRRRSSIASTYTDTLAPTTRYSVPDTPFDRVEVYRISAQIIPDYPPPNEHGEESSDRDVDSTPPQAPSETSCLPNDNHVFTLESLLADSVSSPSVSLISDSTSDSDSYQPAPDEAPILPDVEQSVFTAHYPSSIPSRSSLVPSQRVRRHVDSGVRFSSGDLPISRSGPQSSRVVSPFSVPPIYTAD